jgi:hypothetical protein
VVTFKLVGDCRPALSSHTESAWRSGCVEGERGKMGKDKGWDGDGDGEAVMPAFELGCDFRLRTELTTLVSEPQYSITVQ